MSATDIQLIENITVQYVTNETNSSSVDPVIINGTRTKFVIRLVNENKDCISTMLNITNYKYCSDQSINI